MRSLIDLFFVIKASNIQVPHYRLENALRTFKTERPSSRAIMADMQSYIRCRKRARISLSFFSEYNEDCRASCCKPFLDAVFGYRTGK